MMIGMIYMGNPFLLRLPILLCQRTFRRVDRAALTLAESEERTTGIYLFETYLHAKKTMASQDYGTFTTCTSLLLYY